jgi:molybdopterin-containing oxidoreductase family membrane subunit
MFYPTMWDWGLYIGSIGLFLFLLLLFIRFLPMISVFEMRELVSRQRGHVGAGPSGAAARVDQIEGVTA